MVYNGVVAPGGTTLVRAAMGDGERSFAARWRAAAVVVLVAVVLLLLLPLLLLLLVAVVALVSPSPLPPPANCLQLAAIKARALSSSTVFINILNTL